MSYCFKKPYVPESLELSLSFLRIWMIPLERHIFEVCVKLVKYQRLKFLYISRVIWENILYFHIEEFIYPSES